MRRKGGFLVPYLCGQALGPDNAVRVQLLLHCYTLERARYLESSMLQLIQKYMTGKFVCL